MVIAFFSIKDQERKSYLFKETLLLTYFSMEIAPEIYFFTLSNIEINYVSMESLLRDINPHQSSLNNKQIELIRKIKFTTLVNDPKNKALIIYIIQSTKTRMLTLCVEYR